MSSAVLYCAAFEQNLKTQSKAHFARRCCSDMQTSLKELVAVFLLNERVLIRYSFLNHPTLKQ